MPILGKRFPQNSTPLTPEQTADNFTVRPQTGQITLSTTDSLSGISLTTNKIRTCIKNWPYFFASGVKSPGLLLILFERDHQIHAIYQTLAAVYKVSQLCIWGISVSGRVCLRFSVMSLQLF